jgi:hypothetical protein
MDIFDAYAQINQWIVESSGELIDIGVNDEYRFSRLALFEESDLRHFESSAGLVLPKQYREFLKNVGSVNLFVWLGSGIRILAPSEIKDWSEKVFHNFGDDPYPDLLLALSMPAFGYYGGFLATMPGLDNYSVFYPDVPPELWIEEANFVEFDQWIIRLVDSKCRKVSVQAS